MNAILTLVNDQNITLAYLAEARKHHTQAVIAKHLGVGIRTISRWEARQTSPPAYLAHALQQLLPFGEENPEGTFDFIDLFAGIGGIRKAFEQIGGRCVFTSEWDTYAQKTYAENFRDGHPIFGDITQIQATDIPDHDVLLAGVSLPALLDSWGIEKKCAGQGARLRLRNARHPVLRRGAHHRSKKTTRLFAGKRKESCLA